MTEAVSDLGETVTLEWAIREALKEIYPPLSETNKQILVDRIIELAPDVTDQGWGAY